MALQAFIDDSREGDDLLILAGYAASTERWAQFSAEWDNYLKMTPAWPYFKMVERAQSRDERAWEKVEFMYRLIEEYVQFEICVIVERAVFERAQKRVVIFDETRNVKTTFEVGKSDHHHYGISLLMHEVLNLLEQRNYPHGLDFILDEQRGIQHVTQEAYRMYKEDRIAGGHRFFTEMPIFRDDKKYLPLQAADFLAWWCRAKFIEGGDDALPITTFSAPHADYSWKAKTDIPMLFVHQNEEQIAFRTLKSKVGYYNSNAESLLPEHVQKKYGKKR